MQFHLLLLHRLNIECRLLALLRNAIILSLDKERGGMHRCENGFAHFALLCDRRATQYSGKIIGKKVQYLIGGAIYIYVNGAYKEEADIA
jgi:hypothetical protein